MDYAPIEIAQAVATMHRISARIAAPDPLPERERDDNLDLALLTLAEAVAGDERIESALDEVIKHLNAHANVTWAFARWWDVQTGPVTTQFGAMSTRRWMQLLDAFRTAQEL